MTVFLVIGGLGLAVLLISLVLGDLVDGLFEGLDIDGDGGGPLSGPVLGAFAAAFGFGGALVMSATGGGALLGAAAGTASGVAFGWVAWRLSAALMRMPTDPTVRSEDLRGKLGRVVTTIPDSGYGEITVRLAGQLLKLNARADEPVPTGAGVIVIDVLSTSAVKVIPESDAFGVD